MVTQHEKLKRAFIEGIGVSADIDFSQLSYGASGWDSVAHMQLITHIERAFDLMLETEEVINLSSYEAAVDILRKHEISI